MKKISLLILALLAGLTSVARDARADIQADVNKAGGVYYAYPVTQSLNTAPPKGYKPFYISHYGRHGSRYLIGDNDYKWVLDLMTEARDSGALTPLGQDALRRIELVWDEARGRGGELTPLGTRQHQEIGRRMYDAFPQVFTDDAQLTARSTVVMRCAASMNALCEGLKERNPRLVIPRESSNRFMDYLNYHSPQSNDWQKTWQEEYRKFEQQHTNPDRLVASLFSDPEFVRLHVNPHNLMWGFYWLFADMQNMETPVRFDDLFTTDELYDLWQCFNFRFYAGDANWPRSNHMLLDNAKPLLRNIIISADSVIATGGNGADLRFGHDGNLIPLAGLLRFDGCYDQELLPESFHKAFATYEISPMAGNVQIVFFRDRSGDVICKFMLNEREIAIPVTTDIYPFYRWDDVKAFYKTILDSPDYGAR